MIDFTTRICTTEPVTKLYLCNEKWMLEFLHVCKFEWFQIKEHFGCTTDDSGFLGYLS